MALTIVSYPSSISCSGVYNVTTDLVEDSTHVNLRIRADIHVDSVIMATSEKPKRIPDFDFFDILKSLVPGISFTHNSGDIVKVSGGSPLIKYDIYFTEVWENAGVTTTGDIHDRSINVFIPAKCSVSDFDNYILYYDYRLFANTTLRNNVCKFYTVNPLEYWIVFFTNIVHCELFYSKDGGAYDHATHFDPTDKWGVIILNVGELMSGVTSNLRIQLGEVGGAKISEVMTIYVDNTDIAERVVLEFDGLLGGKEYLAFEGLKNIEFTTIRNYHQGAKKNRKPVSLTGIGRQKVETRFKDMANADYLKSLMISENVKKLELSYATPTDVTVVSDTVKTGSSDMFTNQIDLEYEY